MKYTVSIAVDGRVDVEVDLPADASMDEIRQKATEGFASADLSNMDIINTNPVNVTDENDEIRDF